MKTPFLKHPCFKGFKKDKPAYIGFLPLDAWSRSRIGMPSTTHGVLFNKESKHCGFLCLPSTKNDNKSRFRSISVQLGASSGLPGKATRAWLAGPVTLCSINPKGEVTDVPAGIEVKARKATAKIGLLPRFRRVCSGFRVYLTVKRGK